MANQRQLKLTDLGENWMERATAHPLPLKVSNKLSLNLHQKGNTLRCIEHVPRARRGNSKSREAIRIIDSNPSPTDVYELMRLRSSLLGQTFEGNTVTDICFVIERNRVGVQLKAGTKYGSVKNATKTFEAGACREKAETVIAEYRQQMAS